MDETSKNLKETLAKTPILYVTRDIERALAMEQKGGYSVISNKSGEKLDTYELLKSKDVEDFMKKNPGAGILVFQNNSRIERLCAEKNWKLLNPSAELSKRVEEKLSQIAWLGELSSYLSPHRVMKLKDVMWQGERFVLQFNHAHTGGGTFIIDSEESLGKLVKDFPEREARIAAFIDGPVFTANVVVGDDILVGNISYQITGLPPFTDMPFATIGNDWALPYKILKKEDGKVVEEMARAIGARLRGEGWRGLFGIDLIQDKETRKIYLLEINARQPASTTFESELQKKSGGNLTIFEAHVSALLGLTLKNKPLQNIKSGAQIVLRKTQHSHILKNVGMSDTVKKLEKIGLKVMTYENTEHNKELLRIQTEKSFMKDHNTFSAEGESVRDIVQS